MSRILLAEQVLMMGVYYTFYHGHTFVKTYENCFSLSVAEKMLTDAPDLDNYCK